MGRKIPPPQTTVKHLKPYNQKELNVSVDRNVDANKLKVVCRHPEKLTLPGKKNRPSKLPARIEVF